MTVMMMMMVQRAHPSPPGKMAALSARSSAVSSSSEEPALEDSSSLSAKQYVRGLATEGHAKSTVAIKSPTATGDQAYRSMRSTSVSP